MKKIFSILLALMLAFSLCACSEETQEMLAPVGDIIMEILPPVEDVLDIPAEDIGALEDIIGGLIGEDSTDSTVSWEEWFDWVESGLGDVSDIPEFSGKPYYVINGNQPFFTDDDKITEPFEDYSSFDYLGRCGVAYANICKELMPGDEREDISSVTPSGWKYKGKSNNNEYDTSLVDGGRIYNRCHLIGFQLAGENANEKNLVTGTRYMNVTGMLPFENMIDDYVEETDNHVLYRVTPVYYDEELVCRGVILEGWSVEDNGAGICFNVYCYNVQPGIEIDYATGQNWRASEAPSYDTDYEEPSYNDYHSDAEMTYVLNTSSKKFHYEHCDSVTKMSEKNKEVVTATRDQLVNQGYVACGACNP